jgi:hypothetical protein
VLGDLEFSEIAEDGKCGHGAWIRVVSGSEVSGSCERRTISFDFLKEGIESDAL